MDRKSVSTSLNEELVKKIHFQSMEKLFHSQEYLTDRKKLFFNSQENSFC